jgi:hypothetical protein
MIIALCEDAFCIVALCEDAFSPCHIPAQQHIDDMDAEAAQETSVHPLS